MSPDQEIQLRWIHERDADAFTELAVRYAGMVFATCRRVLGNASDAEDVAQECFIELAQSAKVVSSLGGWLHRVALHRSLNHLRKESRRSRRDTQYARQYAGAALTEWDDIKPHLDAAISDLPEKFRLAIICRFLEGKTQEEVAKALGVSRATVQYRIERGVEEVRKGLERRGVLVAAALLIELVGSHSAEAAPAALIAHLGERALAAYPKAAGSLLAGKAGAMKSAVMSWPGVAGLAFVLVVGVTLLGEALHHRVSPTETVEPIAGGEMREIAEAPQPASMAPETAPGAGVVVAMEGSSVWGRVYAKGNNEPLPFFNVEAHHRVRESDPVAKTTSDDEGNYRLEDLPAGDYVITGYDNRLSYNQQMMGKSSAESPCRGGETRVRIGGAGQTMRADIGVKVDGCLVGNLVLANGAPASGALVWARGENEVHQYWAERASNEAGRFMFIGLEADTTLYIEASKEGYASQVAGPFTVGEIDVKNVKVVLEPAASVEGHAVDASGVALPNAKMFLQSNAEISVHPRFITCDANGHFEAGELAAGGYEFFMAPVRPNPTDEKTDSMHFFWGTIRRVYSVPEPVLHLTLRAGEHRTGLVAAFQQAGISGRVTDASGTAVAGASVTLMGGAGATTDGEGRYLLKGIPAGEHSVYLSHEEYRPQRLDQVASGTQDADFVLEKRGIVAGQVVDARTGAPIEEFSLHPCADQPYAPWMEQWFKKYLVAEGRFTYKPNFPVERIFARAKGYSIGSVLADNAVAGGPPMRVTIRLEPSAPVKGLVVGGDGQPVSGASLFYGAMPADDRGRQQGALAQTDAEGRFVVDTLPAGPVTLVAFHEDNGFGEALTSGQQGDNETLTIHLQAFGELKGHVWAEGQPVAGQAVRLVVFQAEPVDAASAHATRLITATETDAEGAFLFDQIPAGYGQISCELNSQRRFVNTGIVSGETTTADLDLSAASMDGAAEPPEPVME